MSKSKKRRGSAPDVPTYLRLNSGGRDRAFCYVKDARGERNGSVSELGAVRTASVSSGR